MIVEIVILAMVAVFLGLRLYAVLGRRPEQNEEPLRSRVESAEAPRAAQPVSPPRAEKSAETKSAENAGGPRLREIATPEPTGFDPAAEAGIRAIVAADRRFDVGLFLAGARNAYGMILDAFWRGDRAALGELCDATVAAQFGEAITAREAAGEKHDNRLIRIEDASIVSAEFHAPVARITVRFVADIAAVTRDGAGAVVAGSLDDAIESRDVWSFRRDFSQSEIDWQLDEADEG